MSEREGSMSPPPQTHHLDRARLPLSQVIVDSFTLSLPEMKQQLGSFPADEWKRHRARGCSLSSEGTGG